MILSSAMTIAVRHVFKPSDDGVFEPEEHRRLADDFPAGKLSGVWSVTDYCIIDQQIMVGKAILENEDVLKSWENGITLLKKKNGVRNLAQPESL